MLRRRRGTSYRVTAEQLRDRSAGYFMDQQAGIFGMIVSVALGVAGLAAASLFEVRPSDRPYHILFWILWAVSLLSIGVVYSGATVNLFALPNIVPSAPDMFIPLGIGLLEFMLFAVLTSPLTSELAPRSVTAAWFGCYGLFACLATVVLRRVRRLFTSTIYEGEHQEAVDVVIVQLGSDIRGSTASAAAGITYSAVLALDGKVPLAVSYLLAALMAAGMVWGFISQYRQGKALWQGLSGPPEASPAHVPPPRSYSGAGQVDETSPAADPIPTLGAESQSALGPATISAPEKDEMTSDTAED